MLRRLSFKKFSTGVQIKKVLGVLYKGGEEAKNPKLLGCVENALGLRDFLKERNIEFVVTDDKEGANSVFDQHIPTTDVIITTPFHPGYVTKERMEKAKNLKLCVTAGVGSDHIDLPTAIQKGITVAEVTGSNVTSVAEHVVMQTLILLRNFVPAYHQVVNGEWNIAKIASNSYDIEGKVVGTVGAGRIGYRVLERLQGFGCKELLYYDYGRLPQEKEQQLRASYADFNDLLRRCDVVTINCPLHKDTEHLFNKNTMSLMKKGSYLVNTSRGKIVKAEDLVEMLKSGHLAGYAGDVWYPQPAPKDHPWRQMPHHAMTPHCSGTTLDAQARYAAGVRRIIQNFIEGKPQNPTDIIVQGGKLAAQYDKNVSEKERKIYF
jgi:formate dehydrogenase